MGQSEYNTILQVVAKLSDTVAELSDTVAKLSDTVIKLNDRVTKLSDRVTKLSDRVENLSRAFETAQKENRQMFDTILDAFSAPFEKLDTDFQATKTAHNKRLARLEKYIAQ